MPTDDDRRAPRMRLACAILAIIPSLALPALAADTAAAPAAQQRDILQRASRYLGLPAAAPAAELEMRGTRYTGEQAREASVPIAEVEARQTLLIDRDGRYRLRTRTFYPGNIEFRFLTVASAAGSATIDELKWREGIEITRDPAATAREDHADLLFLAPALLLQDALQRHPQTAIDGARATVTFKDGADRPVALTIDTGSGEISAASTGKQRYAYGDYREQHGVRQPQRIEQFNGDQRTSLWTDIALRVRDTPKADAFALPSGYVEKTSRGPLRATALGEGAYRIDGAPSGYHTGFVVGSERIVVFDTPIGVEEAEQVRAVIERTAPGRRIAYVVISHAHRDHEDGLPAYLARGDVEVFTGANAGVALKRRLGDKAPTRLTELTAPRQLDLGNKKVVVDLYPLPGSGHSETMLVGYAPKSRTLFQGDMFYLPEVGPTPPAFDGGVELADLIAKQRLSVADIVGVHGRTGKHEDLTEALRLRKTEAIATSPTATCGTSPDPERVVQAQLDAYNAHDIDAFAACYADDATIYNLAANKAPRKGIPALREDYAFLAQVPKGFRAEIVKRIVSGPIVVDHERPVGLPADKRAIDAIAVYEVRDGKILNVWFPPRE